LRWENPKLSISSPQAKHKGEAELENVWLKTIALKDRTTKIARLKACTYM
jgi:hypothetical protein